jgi:hypothetical protein
MGETRDRDAQLISDEEPAHEADDEYEMVDPSELIDGPKAEALEADNAFTTRPADVAPAIPPPPRVYARTLPPPPPVRRTSTSLPPPPRTTISSAPPLTMSETVPPVPTPSKDPSGDRKRAWSTKRAAAAAAIAAALAAAFFGAKRGAPPTSAPSREVAAATRAPEPQAQPEAVASNPIATAAAVPAPETPDPTPSPSHAATERPSKGVKESAATESKNAQPSASDRAELAAIALQVGAAKAAACTMNFNTIPPSRVALDGRDLGMTPKLGVSVPPGTHVVTFANAGGKKVASASCKPGEQKTVSMRLPI